MLERIDAIMNEVLEPTTFVLAHPTASIYVYTSICLWATKLKKSK